MPPSKANTYRAVLVGLAILIIAAVGYFIYRAVVGTKKVVETTITQTSSSSAVGSGQSIRENAPISNQPAPSVTGQNIVPVGSGSGSGYGSSSSSSGSGYGTGTVYGSSSSGGSSANGGGTLPNGTDTANYGPANGSSPCNAYGSLSNPTCQKQQVYPK
jgi:hypothetical protein